MNICSAIWLTAHLISRHEHQNDIINNDNYGAAVECRINDNLGNIGLVLGTYKNTWNKQTVYAGIGYELVDFKYLAVDLAVGLASGYKDTNPYSPFMAVARIRTAPVYGFSVGLLISPPIGSTGSAYNLTITYRIPNGSS